MLFEINQIRTVVALRPAYNSENYNALIRVANDPKCCNNLTIVASRHDAGKWKAALGRCANVIDWLESSVSEVQANIRNALEVTDTEPNVAVCACFGYPDVREAILTRCGTIQIGNGLSAAGIPDIYILTPDGLAEVLRSKHIGHLGEWIGTTGPGYRGVNNNSPLFIQPAMFASNRYLDPAISQRVGIMFLGRYFSLSDQRREKHQFTKRLYAFKNGWNGGAPIGLVLAKGIAICSDDRYDIITRIPPRPRETDRIGNQLVAAIEHAIQSGWARPALRAKLGLDALSSVRNFPSQKDFAFKGRASNVHGVFRASASQAARVLIVDDVITSGATIIEAARSLYESGASKVDALGIGLNQNVVLRDLDENLQCPKCDLGRLQIRFRATDERAFWGCDGFRDHKCSGLMNWESGLREFNKETLRRNITQIPDIDF